MHHSRTTDLVLRKSSYILTLRPCLYNRYTGNMEINMKLMILLIYELSYSFTSALIAVKVCIINIVLTMISHGRVDGHIG